MGDKNCENGIDKNECDNDHCEISKIAPNQLATLANMVAILLSEGRSSNEVDVIGNFVVGVGSSMLTIAAQMEAIESKQDKIKQINDLKRQIKQLEDSLK